MSLGENNEHRIKFIKTYDSRDEIDTLLRNLETSNNPGIVRDENNKIIKYLDPVIIIDNSQIDPKLKYSAINENRDGLVWITMDGSDSPLSPAMMSDLEYNLRNRNRDWNITERVFVLNLDSKKNLNVSEDEELYSLRAKTTDLQITSDTDEILDEGDLYIYIGSDSLSSVPSVDSNGLNSYLKVSETYDEDSESEFLKIYGDLIIKKQMKQLIINNETGESENINLGSYHYYNIISARDFENGTSFIDLISLSGSKYTSTVNLTGVLRANPEILEKDNNSVVVVGVQFTNDNKMYSREIYFPVFNGGNVSNNFLGADYISTISDLVTVEYHDGCLRVFPETNKVTECIISYCYLAYDGIYE